MGLIDKLIQRVAWYVENIRDEECQLCKDALTNYGGHCTAYTWDMNCSTSGICNFSLYCHTEEIWHLTTVPESAAGRGDIGDLFLRVLEVLNEGDWKKYKQKEHRSIGKPTDSLVGMWLVHFGASVFAADYGEIIALNRKDESISVIGGLRKSERCYSSYNISLFETEEAAKKRV